MPKRTNYKQQVIELLRSLSLPPGRELTRSAMLPHSILNKPREVDVVVRDVLHDPPRTDSYEVVGRHRPATVEWVEQMVQKHRYLPTDHLWLVSWAGFSPDAHRLAVAEHNVTPVTVVSVDGAATLYAEALTCDPSWIAFVLESRDGSPSLREVQRCDAGSAHLLDENGHAANDVRSFGDWVCHRPMVWQKVLEVLANLPNGEEATYVELNVPSSHLPKPMWLADGAGHPARVFGFRMIVGVKFRREALHLQRAHFDREPFAHATSSVLGHPALVVAALDSAAQVQKISLEPLNTGTLASPPS